MKKTLSSRSVAASVPFPVPLELSGRHFRTSVLKYLEQTEAKGLVIRCWYIRAAAKTDSR
jgi:hypothetical protein